MNLHSNAHAIYLTCRWKSNHHKARYW